MGERVSRNPAADDEAYIDEVLSEIEQTTRPVEAYGITERRTDFLEARTRRLGLLAAAADTLKNIDDALVAAAAPDTPPKPGPRSPEDELVDA